VRRAGAEDFLRLACRGAGVGGFVSDALTSALLDEDDEGASAGRCGQYFV
jgi:hypothetical protein